MRSRIIAAFEAYQRHEPFSFDELLKVVREFTYKKTYHLELEFSDFGTAETADDWAQEATIAVWMGLKDGTFRGNSGEEFYSWVHSIAYKKRIDGFNYILGEKENKAPMFVELHEGGDVDAGTFEEENPEIYHHPVINESSFSIPESITGLDKSICDLILDNKTYAEIGELVGISEAAVKKRLQRLRQTEGKRREEEQKAERERNLRERHGPVKVVRPPTAATEVDRTATIAAVKLALAGAKVTVSE